MMAALISSVVSKLAPDVERGLSASRAHMTAAMCGLAFSSGSGRETGLGLPLSLS
jgi:hypothetical protein